MIYLDHAATTQVTERAAQAALHSMREAYFNPSAQYEAGIMAHRAMDGQRRQIAAALHVSPEQLIFTAGGSEGANLAIKSALYVNRHKKSKRIVTTMIEHAAVREQMKALEQQGYELVYLKPDRSGRIAVSQLADAITPETILVSMMAVNNEIGTLMPLEAVRPAIEAARAPALFHTDAVQAFMKLPFNPQRLDVDYASVSGHKIGAPKGIGALYCANPKRLIAPQILGGGQEHGARSGTENMPGIAAFATAVQERSEAQEQELAHMERLKQFLWERVEQTEGLQLLTRGEAPHIVALSLVGYPAENTVRFLDSEFGICVSRGSACHKGKGSHVFSALGLPPAVQEGALRVSLGPQNTQEELETLIAGLVAAREKLAHH